MDESELEACKEALGEIISTCESYKGLASKYEAEEQEAAPPPAVEVEIEAAPVEGLEQEEFSEDEGEPISLVERPADRGVGEVRRKRGPGRPRKGGY